MEVLVTLAHLASKLVSSVPGTAALMAYLPSLTLIEQLKQNYDIKVLLSGFHLPSTGYFNSKYIGKDAHQDNNSLLSRLANPSGPWTKQVLCGTKSHKVIIDNKDTSNDNNNYNNNEDTEDDTEEDSSSEENNELKDDQDSSGYQCERAR
ncbi:hypothetical protein VNI00_019025 [Paramarasmius palmivorus]|uniref:Uncharacterized protein n=1 Tax=Paramarasmius palmivorus TaxID=297713 RepID=A0AAW0AR78_9AGAR